MLLQHPYQAAKRPAILDSLIDPQITEEDITAIPPVFWRKPKATGRRCKQAWLNRIKRIAAAAKLNEANLIVADFAWGVADTTILWQMLLPRSDPTWKTKSRPWNFLIQYIYRTDISDNIIERAQALGRCKNITVKFQQNTGYRINFVTETDAVGRTKAFDDLIQTSRQWFSHLAIISDRGLSIRKIEDEPVSVHQPLQAEPHDLPIVLTHAKICEAISTIWPLDQLRLLKIFADPPGQPLGYATQFIPWESEPYATYSGTILIGVQEKSGGPLQMFLVNTHTWMVRYDGALLESKSVKRALASHYASLGAVYKTQSS